MPTPSGKGLTIEKSVEERHSVGHHSSGKDIVVKYSKRSQIERERKCLFVVVENDCGNGWQMFFRSFRASLSLVVVRVKRRNVLLILR